METDSPHSMTSSVKDPYTLIKEVVSARHQGSIEPQGYRAALEVLERHFIVYEQRLSVMTSPASFSAGEVMLDAAGEGLQLLQGAVRSLQNLDPHESPEEAALAVEKAGEGFQLLSQLREVNQQAMTEFEEAYRDLQDSDFEYDYDE